MLFPSGETFAETTERSLARCFGVQVSSAARGRLRNNSASAAARAGRKQKARERFNPTLEFIS